MRLLFFSKCWKFYVDFINAMKIWQKVIDFLDKTNWIFGTIFSLLLREYLSPAFNALANNPSISTFTKRELFTLNLFLNNKEIG